MTDHAPAPAGYDCAFVLGGGGSLGAHEVGMLQALLDAGIRPDLVLGTSVGAINGALVAADPSPASVERLSELWQGMGRAGVFAGSLADRVGTAVRSRTHLYSNGPLRALLEEDLGKLAFEDLAVPFQCVAACVERSAERWFSSGPLVPAILASSAVPGLLPPVRVDGEHFLDGGLVNSIPVGRAVALGARTVYVLQVGRIEQPLSVPRRPWEVASVCFEIARRHRFARDMDDLPDDVTVHVLPTGSDPDQRLSPARQLRHRDFGSTRERIERAHRATAAYLEALGPDRSTDPRR
ncbi:patatin-like phospholipase family protein [Streptacidiphilus sp. PB12-B1b]|uniref:patatin-like phospholipase family protein n=1 Tax=Streptacidiphilus sp. PB12-B1b TaxID=2705012 RepID=UPI0015FE4614|nr:patatin-like phospholipase family protein [Streptacidiphilus sp. PB12-B1b]QMU77092.1 patatin-like phospholipase family protein [Streptacidiphilus sp. PB12-B1b]